MANRKMCEVCGKVDKPANTYTLNVTANTCLVVNSIVNIDICCDCKNKLLEQLKKARESLDVN